MSEPKIYKVGKIGTTETIDCVSYEDYEKLKADVERLTKAEDKMIEVTYMKGIAGIDREVQS